MTTSIEPTPRRALRATRRAAPHVLCGAEIRDEVLRRVVARVLERARGPHGPTLEEAVHETLYDEKLPDAYLGWLRHELARADQPQRERLVRAIVSRYTDEISGHFDARVYRVATTVLPAALCALKLDDRIRVDGAVASLLELARVGTVVLAPTHVSNLDSVLLGYAIHRLGLPPFAYGAGLNLFSNALVGFFLRNLGAYTIDRKKKDPLYKDTLKEYSTTLLARGQDALFFAGGTRSRSGAIESHLKKGLLGTAAVAFQRALVRGAPRPRVFVVPCTLTYPLVLEGASLVDEYLRAEGRARYIDLHDEFEKPRRWIDFLRGLFELDLHVHVRIGAAIDVIGNAVDADGTSRDRRGRPVDPARYFMVDGAIAKDAARDAEYTRAVERALLAAYRRDTVAIPESTVAFAIFARLRRARKEPDLFRLLRAIGPDASVAESDVRDDVGRLVAELRALADRGALRLSPAFARGDAASITDAGIRTLGIYHATPVLTREGDRVKVGDPRLLFYYKNRLDGFGLSP